MFRLRPFSNSPFRILCTIILPVMVVGAVPPQPASAQTGVVAFQDHCTQLLYAIRGDGTDRIALPLPALPEPASNYQHRGARILDVTSSGPPLTVVYWVSIVRRDTSAPVHSGLFAVQLNDVGGNLIPDSVSPVRLDLPSNISNYPGVNPNRAQHGSFSAAGDRLALVAGTETSSMLMTVRVDRDEFTSKITGLSALVVVAELYSLAVRDPSISGNGFTHAIDYSPDGNRIVAAIYHDLWMIHLNSANEFVKVEQLTPNSDGVAAWNPSYSPDGRRIAYTAAPSTTQGLRSTDIYSLAVATGAITRVTTKTNAGKAASARDRAMWTADSVSIGFTAYTSSTPRRAPCSTLVNSEIFLIRADGSSTASQITNTNGTSVEGAPKWGW